MRLASRPSIKRTIDFASLALFTYTLIVANNDDSNNTHNLD